jgi:Cytochrome P450
MLDHPDDVQIALNSPNANSKGFEYEFLNIYPDAQGLITANGEMWKNHRKLLNPCFIPKILDAYLPIFNDSSKVLVEKIAKMSNGNKMFDIEPLIHCCTFDQICGELETIFGLDFLFLINVYHFAETTMGVQLDIQNNVDHQMLISCDRFLNIVTNRFYKFWIHPDFIYQRTKSFIQQQKDVNYIRDFSCNVLNKIKDGLNSGVASEQDEDERKPISFINQMLKISKENDAFNNKEVICETITAIMAVSDSSMIFYRLPVL